MSSRSILHVCLHLYVSYVGFELQIRLEFITQESVRYIG